MECSSKTLSFTVSRKRPELITPAEVTPHEFKALSDIDDHDGLRVDVPCIGIYAGSPSMQMQGKDPVKIIRDAIAKALVFYYPYAGRLREIATRKLVVECTAEGVLFIEADADVTVNQLPLHPPFPFLDQLLYDLPGAHTIIDCPLILFQVTRLKCGGFIFALRCNHCISDAAGMVQFMSAIGELARGGEVPSLPPVWERHLLSARNPPCVSFAHPEIDLSPAESKTILPPLENMVERSFFFSTADLSTLRHSLPPQFRSCSRFDLVATCIWRCRTKALSLNRNEECRLLCIVSIRNKIIPPLPRGYYGNAVMCPVAFATAEELWNNPLHCITERLKKAKAKATMEYAKSAMDMLVMNGRPGLSIDRNFVVSDLGGFDTDEVQFGWGKATYFGVARGSPESVPGMMSWFIPWNNGIIVPISLPADAMEAFRKELKMIMEVARKSTISNASAL